MPGPRMTNETSTEATKATSQSSSNDGASKNLQSCHIPELKKGHILRASCFSDPATQQLVHSELDLNHCFGASLLKGELSAEAEGRTAWYWNPLRGMDTLLPLCCSESRNSTGNNQGLLECHGHVGKPISLAVVAFC
ncbi:hypothetical protein AO1008_07850 [Aspergillus oryzae 100-8]|uniref:Cyanovirin-N domain-containing protein n=1 Tax=Aspergillus oryzae (strain 3.042) TaxID=1160506 RepID=I7ZT95_ASPO3|nr:hypothetical protein Ao3042_08973 [Aspergillus oryzae 3.042]KDE81223.1 hypothetical protein AO1008_07850 [Aspergillus oryzae 100-8]|eukprot:EIT75264.1 hypothetical protein Ao3042_08973 [Aspergillus oryzae 3.042]